jgi:hypothetical protein
MFLLCRGFRVEPLRDPPWPTVDVDAVGGGHARGAAGPASAVGATAAAAGAAGSRGGAAAAIGTDMAAFARGWVASASRASSPGAAH